MVRNNDESATLDTGPEQQDGPDNGQKLLLCATIILFRVVHCSRPVSNWAKVLLINLLRMKENTNNLFVACVYLTCEQGISSDRASNGGLIRLLFNSSTAVFRSLSKPNIVGCLFLNGLFRSVVLLAIFDTKRR